MTEFPSGWPRTHPSARTRGQFGDMSIARLISDLQYQMKQLDAHDLRVDTDLQMRRDGLPYSNQRQPDDPGVVVYWRVGARSYAIACDAYDRVNANLRAIVKTIEAKRGIDRWGAATAEREFAGYEALPPPSGASTLKPRRPPHEVLGVHQDAPESVVAAAFRARARELHPDVAGGDADAFRELKEARDELLRQRKERAAQ